MADNFYMIETALETGMKLEAVPGTAETLTQTEFNGNWEATLIAEKKETIEIKRGGDVGTSKIVNGKSHGELNSLKVPMGDSQGVDILKCAGARVITSVGTDFIFGGDYSSLVGADKGRLSTPSLTVVQYDGKYKHTIHGAKPTSLKIGGKVGERILMEAALSGKYSRTLSSPSFKQVNDNTLDDLLVLSNTLTLDGTSFDFTDIEVDTGLDTKLFNSGTTVNGLSQVEVINVDPKITLTVRPGDPSTKDLLALFDSNAPIPFAWGF